MTNCLCEDEVLVNAYLFFYNNVRTITRNYNYKINILSLTMQILSVLLINLLLLV